MTLTPFALVFGCLALAAVLAGRGWYWTLAILSVPFQAASVFVIGQDSQSGFQPSYLAACLCIVFGVGSLFGRIDEPAGGLVRQTFRWAWAFIAFSAPMAILVPNVFPGLTMVMPFRAIGNLVPLSESPSNARHALYIAVNVTAAFMLAVHLATAKKRDIERIVKTWKIAAGLAVLFFVWHAAHLYAGIAFPAKVLYNNPSAAQLQHGELRPELQLNLSFRRVSGVCTEPSIAAMYGSAIFGVLLLFTTERRSRWRSSLLLLGVGALCLLIGSSSGYFALFALVGWVVVKKSAETAGTARLYKIAAVGAVVVVGFLVALAQSDRLQTEVETILRYQVIGKLDDDARVVGGRTDIERNAVKVFLESPLIGVGLGSNISHTAWGYTLSNTGAIGALLLGLFLWEVRRNKRRAQESQDFYGLQNMLSYFGVALLGVALTGMVGVPILLHPLFWLLTGTIVGISCRIQRPNVVVVRSPDACAAGGRCALRPRTNGTGVGWLAGERRGWAK